MEKYRKYEPIFGSWHLSRLIGKGSFGKVFEITREEFGTTYRSALKIITVPQDDDDIKSMMTEGTDIKSISEYYNGILREIINENEIMAQLKGNSNIVSYEDHQIIPHEDGIGYDILIRMELLTPLIDRMVEKKLDEKEVVKLGIDICKALELCHRKNIIHRDIKPQNIFISENGDFKLGDFGIARTMEKTTGGMSKKGTYKYMAPEVFRGEHYDSTVDIYSLGIVLYSLLNGNRGPFLPPPPAKVTHNDEEEARMRRFRGERLPDPRDAGRMLTYIIRKACAYSPADRYHTAGEMRMDLESYYNNYGNLSVQKPEYIDREVVQPRVITPAPKKRSMIIPIGIISGIIVIALITGTVLFLHKGNDSKVADTGADTTEVAEQAETPPSSEDTQTNTVNEPVETEPEQPVENNDSEEAGTDFYSDDYVAYNSSGYHIFYFNTNGGEGYFPEIEVGNNNYFDIPSSAPTRAGSNFCGWHVMRLVDGKWYCKETFSWIDWDGSYAGNVPYLYEPGFSLLFDDSWEKNGGSDSNYVFYAVWD